MVIFLQNYINCSGITKSFTNRPAKRKNINSKYYSESIFFYSHPGFSLNTSVGFRL